MDGAAAPAETARQVSANEIDYASFVLYVKQGVSACELLRRLAAKSNDVIVQDVEQIRGARPPWLKGVPSLVRLKDYQLFTGTAAIQALKTHLSAGIQGIGSDFGARSSRTPAALDDFDDAPAAVGGFDLRLASDERYSDAPKEKNLGGMNLESMMRLRSGQA